MAGALVSTILAAVGNILPSQREEDAYPATVPRRPPCVAADCTGQQAAGRERAPPKPACSPLLAAGLVAGRPCRSPRGGRAHRAHRHRQPAARRISLADLLAAAATDSRCWPTGGALARFPSTSVLERLDPIGREHAAAVPPTVVGRDGGGVQRRGGNRVAPPRWISPLCARMPPTLPSFISAPPLAAPTCWAKSCTALAESLLAAIMRLYHGCDQDSGPRRSNACSTNSAGRWCTRRRCVVARFGSANEYADWETAHHVFTVCQRYPPGARADRRRDCGCSIVAPVDAMRGILSRAMALYLARYLNVPPARGCSRKKAATRAPDADLAR